MVRGVYLEIGAWTPQNGMATPTMKLKRDKLEQKYARQIVGIYDDLKAEAKAAMEEDMRKGKSTGGSRSGSGSRGGDISRGPSGGGKPMGGKDKGKEKEKENGRHKNDDDDDDDDSGDGGDGDGEDDNSEGSAMTDTDASHLGVDAAE